MNALKDKIREEISDLLTRGVEIHSAEWKKETDDKIPAKKTASKTTKKAQSEEAKTEKQVFSLPQAYQAWYTKALPVVKQILPDRYADFVEQYKLDKRKDITYLTYTISDYLIGLRITRGWEKENVVNAFGAFSSKFEKQLTILSSCLERLDSVLSDIQGTLQAELFDDELDAAQELHKKGHLRAAGALCGVTLERHLATVAKNHGVNITKKDPTISDFNDAFKNANIYDVPNWRFIQRLGDIRNLSVHFKGREPTKDDVDEMITGTQKVLKTVF